jgi:hypothetical protein
LQSTHWTWGLEINPLSALTVESKSVFYRYGGLSVAPGTFFAPITAFSGDFFAFASFSFYSYVGRDKTKQHSHQHLPPWCNKPLHHASACTANAPTMQVPADRAMA